MPKVRRNEPFPKMKTRLLPWVSFKHDLRLMIYRPHGVLNETELKKTVAMLEEVEKEDEAPFNRYSDLSQLDAVDLPLESLLRISLHRRLSYEKHPPVKSAFFVTSPATAQIVRTHAILTEHTPLQVKMFEQVEPAASWLGVEISDLEMVA